MINRKKFIYILIIGVIGVITTRWIYLFNKINTKRDQILEYLFDSKEIKIKSFIFPFKAEKSEIFFNKIALENVKTNLKFNFVNNEDLENYMNYEEYKFYNYKIMEKEEFLSSGFYFTKNEITIINNLK
tara:strand:- start:1499 stop:1885 length:387 start_codon:yes stop_codon:yes gene_type:complete